MVVQHPSMQDLFMQLGLDSSEEKIEEFIAKHRGVHDSRHLEDAPFWNEAQAEFIQNAYVADAEWVVVIDKLNVRLHQDKENYDSRAS
ncbi:DUF2789 domain-containing protein [Alteromonas pelagimontana]|uniref:DUF2789 domain-containing protein n=1 Tax=Alteromonas pelagimontana TaxID=1858656 RepID=A0A6M4MHC7_9ALTE|nr:DUF2789 family protein [Alteromonas pelagimontana]QJR82328.1 DUF2789 domain-containing protein [Alteromonas pelagimontana]